MPEKLIYVKPIEMREEFTKKVWLKEYGNYNSIPDPVEPIDDQKFADIAGRGTPDYIEYRVIKDKQSSIFDPPNFTPAYIYWYADNGLMIIFNDDVPMKFFLIGCYHELEELTEEQCANEKIKHSGPGLHIFKCSKCGYIDEVYDSPFDINQKELATSSESRGDV